MHELHGVYSHMRVRALAMDENAFVGPFKLNTLITTRLEEVRMIVHIETRDCMQCAKQDPLSDLLAGVVQCRLGMQDLPNAGIDGFELIDRHDILIGVLRDLYAPSDE